MSMHMAMLVVILLGMCWETDQQVIHGQAHKRCAICSGSGFHVVRTRGRGCAKSAAERALGVIEVCLHEHRGRAGTEHMSLWSCASDVLLLCKGVDARKSASVHARVSLPACDGAWP